MLTCLCKGAWKAHLQNFCVSLKTLHWVIYHQSFSCQLYISITLQTSKYNTPRPSNSKIREARSRLSSDGPTDYVYTYPEIKKIGLGFKGKGRNKTTWINSVSHKDLFSCLQQAKLLSPAFAIWVFFSQLAIYCLNSLSS